MYKLEPRSNVLRVILVIISVIGGNLILTGQTISAGLDFTMMVCENQAVSTCGKNTTGQLGNGTNVSSYIPVVVGSSLTDIIAVSAGGEHSLALKSDGTLKAWGRNSFGELGTNGSNNINANPLSVIGLTNVISMSAGYNASIALTSDGKIWTWGLNEDGVLGQGNNLDLAVPTLVQSIDNAQEISMFSRHTLLLKNDSTVWSTGLNGYGQLGIGSIASSNTFTMVSGITNAIAVASGGSHSLVLVDGGIILAFGRSSNGQLATDGTISSSLPDTVRGIQDVVQISAGKDFSMALLEDSTVWMWGRNNSGQLGNNTTSQSNVPVQVIGLSQVVEISAGDRHSIAKKADGSIWVWGSAALGTLGSGNSTNSLVPIEIIPFCGSITSTSDETTNSEISIYPNPSKGQVSVKLDEPNVEGLISIRNMLGQEVFKLVTHELLTNLNLSHLQKGMYLVSIQHNGSIQQSKLMLN